MIEKQTLIGIILLAVSVGLLAATIWRFQWMQQKIGFLLHWGRGSWSFPASRIGVAAGSIVGITIGSMSLDSKFELLSRDTWFIIFLVSCVIALVGAIHDYILYRRRSA